MDKLSQAVQAAYMMLSWHFQHPTFLWVEFMQNDLKIESPVLDGIDRRLVETLSANARTTTADLARQVGMSAPSVADRLRRLEDSGVIRAYTLDVDPVALGYSLEAIVRIRPLPGQLRHVEGLIQEISEFVECDKVTGDDCFIARMVLRSISHLDGILERVTEYAETNTSIVKAHTVRRRLPPLR
jgi:Lrp/AsnC family leucine-responsive transcriptional regulator